MSPAASSSISPSQDFIAPADLHLDRENPRFVDLGYTDDVDIVRELYDQADVDELIQVFSNLIENACKYGQAGKRVLITVADTEAEGAHVTVKDFGPGIAKEHVARLTERF